MIKVLIADDEHLARETIKYLLNNQSEAVEFTEAENGTQVIELCQQQRFDIIFLDIQMPGKTGIEVADKVAADSVIIFATAYDQYAIEAFDLSAVDYLLKPFDDDRFYQAFDKAKQKVAAQQTTDFDKVSQLIEQLSLQKDHQYKKRLVTKEPGKIKLIEVDQIEYILGAGNYADIYFYDGSHILHRETLTALEQQLNPELFVRIHRSSIVRKSSVKELRANDNGDYTVIVKSGYQLTLSRRNKDKLNQLLSE